MKQTKVGNVKPAVSATQEHRGGILYKDPHKKLSILDVDDHVRERSDAAKKLYTVLNTSTVFYEDSGESEKQKIIETVMKHFSSCFQGDKKNKDTGDMEAGLLGSCNRKNMSEVYKFLRVNSVDETELELLELTGEELAELIISKALRKSLRREVKDKDKDKDGETYDLIQIAKELLLIMSIQGSKEKLTEYPQKKLLRFVECLVEDRERIGERTAVSIKKQNVKVQPAVGDNADLSYLMLSNADHEKKRWIAEFVKQYAGADATDQAEMIQGKKKLILSYVYGTEIVEKEFRNQNVWGNMPRLSGADNLFDDGIVEPEKEWYSLDERQIRQARIKHFRAIENKKQEHVSEQRFWLQYFDHCVEKLSKVHRKMKKRYFTCDALSNYLWKEWTSYIAMKYVDLGKGVYHFAMPNLKPKYLKRGLEMGVVRGFEYGISSFDYERVKAEESLCRDIAVSAVFSGSVFGRAVANDEYRLKMQPTKKGDIISARQEDVLQYTDKQLEENYAEIIRSDALHRLLMYFGGASRWTSDYEGKFSIDGKNKEIEKQFVQAGIRQIGNIRNMSFHYSTSSACTSDGHRPLYDFTRKLFLREYEQLPRIIGEKYCNNNVPVFYKTEAVYPLIRNLYKTHIKRKAQIPSFQSVLKKNSMEMEAFIRKSSGDGFRQIASNTDVFKKYKASVYFLLKEIYYYEFLQRNDLISLFDAAMKKIGNNPENEYAFRHFEERVAEVRSAIDPEMTQDQVFSILCQQIMTDVNMQNQGHKKIQTTAEEKRASGKTKKIYKHFDYLLHQCLREAFVTYLENNHGFLLQPVFRDNWFGNSKGTENGGLEKRNEKIEEFINGIPEIHIFDLSKDITIKDIMMEKDRAVDWYMLSHFLQGKQINLLLGDIRSYIRYAEAINERAYSTDNKKNSSACEKKKHYEEILAVLEFVQMFTGRVSHEATDYFSSEEDYCKHLAYYVDFGGESRNDLLDFCRTADENSNATDHSIGIYVDGQGNPIINKNIVHAKMYGNEKKLEQCVKKVTLEEIRAYYRLSKELKTVFEKGACKTKEEWKRLKEFQNLKNRIELFDISIYADIVNDMMGQMVSWAYLRERDLLYFQLGYYYTRLYFTDAIPKKDKFRQLEGDGIRIADGAILYQIIAMYDHTKTVYKVNSQGQAEPASKQGSAGASVVGFVKEYCGEGTRAVEDAPTYFAGLQFFEDVNRHDEFSDFRNDIAHMKYMVRADENLLDMYSKIYNGFFFYDTKLRKSVSYIFKNILERYSVIAYTEMDHANGISGFRLRLRTNEEAEIIKRKNECGLKSDSHIRKLAGNGDGKKAYADVRSTVFLEQLENILEYKD